MRNILFLFFAFMLSVSFSQQKKALNNIIDEWHQNAANAAFDAYFDITSDDFVFLGTAPEERWEKKISWLFVSLILIKNPPGILSLPIDDGTFPKMAIRHGLMSP